MDEAIIRLILIKLLHAHGCYEDRMSDFSVADILEYAECDLLPSNEKLWWTDLAVDIRKMAYYIMQEESLF